MHSQPQKRKELLMKTRWSIKNAFVDLNKIKQVLGPRLEKDHGLSEVQRHKLAVRLLNMIVNLGQKPEESIIEEVWQAIIEAEELLHSSGESWIEELSNVELLLQAVTFVKAAWSPDLTERR